MFCAGFFHTRKKFKNFSKEVIKSHLSFPIWCGKRDKHFSKMSMNVGRLLKVNTAKNLSGNCEGDTKTEKKSGVAIRENKGNKTLL